MEYSLKVSIAISIFYLFYILFLKNDTFFQFNRIFLLIGIPISFVIPFIIFNNYIDYTTSPILTSHLNLEPVSSTIITKNTETPFSIWQLVPILYIFGIIIFSLNFIVQFIGVFKIIHKSKVAKNDNFIAVETNKDILPFSFFKWVVYNPNAFTKIELTQILAHEKVHIKQRHSLDILIVKIAAAALWFNPFIWLYLKSVKQNLEFIADAGAQESLACKKTYQYTLLKTGFTNKQIVIANNFFHSPIKKRIMMLQKRKTKKIYQFKYLLILPILGFFLMNFNTKDVYIEKNTDPIKIDFHKNLTDNDLKNIQNKLKKDSIDFIYQLKRNKQKEIIQFSSEFKSVTGSVKANTQSDKKGIASFYFFYGDKGNGVKFLNQKTNLKNSNPNIIEIVFNKNTTLKKLKEQSKYLKENYNINFDFEIENKDKKLADFKHSFYNGEQKHEATFLKVFPFSSINHSFILKYNIETKLLWIDAIVDGVTYDSTSKRYLDNNSVGFYIDNTDTDKTLKKYKKLMKEKGVDIAFLDIKRDSKNRITAIRIHAKTKNSKSSYNYKLDGKTYNGLAISFYSNGNGLKIKPVLNTF